MEVFQGHQEAGMVLLPKLEAVAVEIEYPFAILERNQFTLSVFFKISPVFSSLNIVTCFLQVSIQGINVYV